MEIANRFLPVEVAQCIHHALTGLNLPEGKLLLAVKTSEIKTKSGLYIPGDANKLQEMAKKGVILDSNIDDDYVDWDLYCGCIGKIVTFGDYAGKVVQIEQSLDHISGYNKNEYEIRVLSVTEVVMVENNPVEFVEKPKLNIEGCKISSIESINSIDITPDEPEMNISVNRQDINECYNQ